MASLSINLFSSLPRQQRGSDVCPYMNTLQLHNLGSLSKWILTAASEKRLIGTSRAKKKARVGTSDEESVSAENGFGPTEGVKKTRTRKKNKVLETSSTESHSAENGNVKDVDIRVISGSSDTPKKSRRATTQKKATTSSRLDSVTTEKKVTGRKGNKKILNDSDNERALELDIEGGEDISFTYGWPPLVCIFGAAHQAFVPSARRAHRLVDHEDHERRKDVLWTPEKFMRAPGGSASNVAVSLARLGGKAAFMGKLGDDDFGISLLYFLNINNVQTRSVCIDNKKQTAISKMKMIKRGGLKMSKLLKPCAEDSLSTSEINIDVLKEAKLFYFSTFSLLDPNMRSTALGAIKISKQLGGIVFYDLNLPLPLWKSSSEETKAFVQQAWELADIIEVTKQELEFLCQIDPVERFDTKDNDKTKFTHHLPEVIAPIWHEGLKVLFVTNGTSKIHYYTKEFNGAVLGMEDAPLTPYTCDMSASGDGIIAGLLRMLAVQPELITDKGHMESTIKYAINCGVIDQWLLARKLGYPPKEGTENDVEPDDNGIRSITEKEYRTYVPVH
ncbi:unnamed protein product [Cuscuta epithymum]|uniref:Carbohydrate kinase PfkB domain-containing protein n=2 Tax=Cuscuta epithymum TaxID=186058 RepID=A0AAV0DV62_9ASTE|nr:unnamed protein product [Cuscuta epithymum]CAH9131146.1 unnamed protein product [Cuscuta epithymum]